jgi:hypothetical protein
MLANEPQDAGATNEDFNNAFLQQKNRSQQRLETFNWPEI